MASIRIRLLRLENKRRFLHWFAMVRLFNTMTVDELETFAGGGNLPETLLNRPSKLDKLDLKSLIKRWKQADRILGGRSREELECYAESGFWPEQRGCLHYSMQDGKVDVRSRTGPKGGTSGTGTTAQHQGTSWHREGDPLYLGSAGYG
jgi:hypothetical protein